MKKVVRKALVTAKAYRPGKAGGGMLMPGHPQREANRAAFMGQNHPDVPKVLYHGSNSAFPSFDRDEVKHNQLGFHVGSINQANHFASDPREEDFNRSKKPNVMPVHIMAKNPLRLKDEGEWSAENLRDQLLEAGAKHEDVARLISLEQQESITPADIANVIKSLGYDSVVYLNRNEGVDQKDKAEYAKKMAGQWSDPKGVSYKSMYKLDDDEFRQNFPSARDSYILFDPSQIKSATGNQGAFDPNEDDINKAAGGRTGYRAGGYAYKADGGEIDDWHSVHEREAQHFADGGVAGAPQKTVKAYKLFKTKKSAPGKLFPLFVDANTPVPVGQWVDAKAGEPGKTPGKVKSKLGDLAFRPGWHAGDLPIATHIGGRSSDEQGAPPDYRPADQVWAEVEMPDDVDWQSVANSRGQRTKAGTIDPKTAHITDQVPVGGHYRYKTNSNMTGNWMIGGSMRVNRILSDDEVKSINDAAGTADLPRHPDYPKMATGGRTGYADGGSTGKLHARLVNSMNFYSRGAEAARQLSQKKGSPQQMRAMLEKAGVKPEEFAQSGFDEAFSGKPSVTSEEIFQHFHHKKPDVRATQLLSREHDDYDPDATYETQFDEFTLHGLQNYREHLLKLPEGNNNFEESRHWPGQKNVVAHIRMGDRRTPADLAASRDAIEKMRTDPNLTRSIGEEPANWGSGAADLAVSRGTITKEEAQNLSRIKRWRNAVMEGYKPERVLHVEEIQSDWGQAGRKHGFQDQSADGPPDPNKPPQGPFVNSTPGWTNLALKHVLTEAVKGGYNKLVISPGQANADMYGLDEGRENGMKSFYDQIVPTQLNKLAKGLDPDHPGVQMFSHTLPPAWGGDEEGYKGHALEITDGMRDAVKKGLPMYKRGGMAPISNPMVGKAMALARNLTRR